MVASVKTHGSGETGFREDKMINPAPGFWKIPGPLGPTAGPGSLGTGSGSKYNAGYQKISSGDQL